METLTPPPPISDLISSLQSPFHNSDTARAEQILDSWAESLRSEITNSFSDELIWKEVEKAELASKLSRLEKQLESLQQENTALKEKASVSVSVFPTREETSDEEGNGFSIPTPQKKRTCRRVVRSDSDSDSDSDDNIPIGRIFNIRDRKRKRRLVRMGEAERERDRNLEFTDSEDSLGDFIVSDSSQMHGEEEVEWDSDVGLEQVLSKIRRDKNKNKNKNGNNGDWECEVDMLSDLCKEPELCLKAVCALYKRQTDGEQLEKATLVLNGRGFSQVDAPRATTIAEFLMCCRPYGPLTRTIEELKMYNHYGVEYCEKIATKYSKQLFAIYQEKEDPYFHP